MIRGALFVNNNSNGYWKKKITINYETYEIIVIVTFMRRRIACVRNVQKHEIIRTVKYFITRIFTMSLCNGYSISTAHSCARGAKEKRVKMHEPTRPLHAFCVTHGHDESRATRVEWGEEWRKKRNVFPLRTTLLRAWKRRAELFTGRGAGYIDDGYHTVVWHFNKPVMMSF